MQDAHTQRAVDQANKAVEALGSPENVLGPLAEATQALMDVNYEDLDPSVSHIIGLAAQQLAEAGLLIMQTGNLLSNIALAGPEAVLQAANEAMADYEAMVQRARQEIAEADGAGDVLAAEAEAFLNGEVAE